MACLTNVKLVVLRALDAVNNRCNAITVTSYVKNGFRTWIKLQGETKDMCDSV